MRTTLLALGSLCTSALLACTIGGQDSLSEGQVKGLGKADRLTSAEWAAFNANRQYIHARFKTDTRVRLNFADRRQYDFAMARLKLAGKNPENSPYLFELIEARRQSQIAAGFKAGAFAEVLEDGPTSADRRDMHYFEQASVAGRSSGLNAAAGEEPAYGTAATTFVDGTDYTYEDIRITSASGLTIGPFAFAEEIENANGNVGANVTVNTSGDGSVSAFKLFIFESYKIDVIDDVFMDSYTRHEEGIPAPQPRGGLPVLSAPQIAEPVDWVGPNGGPADGIFSCCVDRSWTNDCDRILNSGRPGIQKVELPLKGSVGLTSDHMFDSEKIARMKNGLDPATGTMKLVLTNWGGGCDVTDENALVAKMLQFWKTVTLSHADKVLSWDMTGPNVAFFDDGCRQVQDLVKLTSRLPLPILSRIGREPSTVSITVTSDPSVARPEALLSPITMTNSCLAEGTQIELGDGAFAPVESLQIGQSTFNPFAREGQSLTIMDTAAGIEKAPMVRIRDDAGRTLLLTELHPVATPDRGMVQARALRVGDSVMTKDGASKLAEVGREPYTGKVYNLKVGSNAEMKSLDADQTVVYANGFVVGDGQIQSKYETLVRKQEYSAKQVPEKWRRDYESMKRK